MSDLPSKADLIIATCQAGQAIGVHLTEGEATAILDAILPLVMRGRPIAEAPKDKTPILARFKDHLRDNRPDLDPWRGITVVIRHPGVMEDGFDIGWNMAAPVGHGGFPDDWIECWWPLSVRQWAEKIGQPPQGDST